MTLTPKQLQEFEQALRRRRDALEAETRADAEKVRADTFSEVAGQAPDIGDEAVADLIADTENAELSRDLAELRAVEAALDRIRQGRYGVCTDCGGEIELERLRLQPAALRCFRCQQIFEKTFARPPRSSL